MKFTEKGNDILVITPPSPSLLFFFYFGFVYNLGFTVFSSTLDFFSSQFEEENVHFNFMIPKYMGSLSAFFLIILFESSIFFSKTKLIILSTVMQSVILIVVPIFSIILPDKFGLKLIFVFVFIFGVFNTIMVVCLISLIYFFPPNCISTYAMSILSSGIIITIVRMIILLCTAFDNESLFISTLLYFSLASFCYGIFPIILLKFFDNEIVKNVISQSLACSENSKLLIKFEKKTFFGIGKKIWPIMLAISITTCITSMMFPGLTLERKINILPLPWSTTTLNFIVYSFGVCGNLLARIKIISNRNSVFFFALTRILFMIPFRIIAENKHNSNLLFDIAQMVNLAIFFFLHGFFCAWAIAEAPKHVEEIEKEKCGTAMSFAVVSGLIGGGLIAVVVSQ